MSKFSLKNIFIKSDETSDSVNETTPNIQKNNTVEENTSKFPTQNFSNPSPQVSVSDAILNQVLEVYEKGFDSLNKPGYDFYEYFKALHSVNDFTPAAYKMAFQMGRAMNATLDKNGLILNADNYILEINKVHENYRNQGEVKKNDLLKTQENEKLTISNQIATLENQINGLKNQIAQLESNKHKNEELLAPIETKYHPELKLIEEKLHANNSAKEIIVSKINVVKHGILTNI